MSELPKRGTRNYDVEYLEYVRDKTCIVKLKDGKKLVVELISVMIPEYTESVKDVGFYSSYPEELKMSEGRS